MNTLKIFGMGLFSLLLLGCGAALTTDDIRILEENDDYVVVSFEGKTGKLYKHFEDPFEEPDFLKWFEDGRWTTMSLLSPAAKDVEAYAALRTKIFSGESDFIDNRIESTQEIVFEGERAAKFIAVGPSDDMVTSKAMLEQNSLYFINGDHLWFRGHYYLEKGVPFTILDFQERGRSQSPGPRITIWEKTHIGIELKHGGKPQLRQTRVKIPLKQWFEIKVHLHLDDDEGLVQIWQDQVLILEGKCRRFLNLIQSSMRLRSELPLQMRQQFFM